MKKYIVFAIIALLHCLSAEAMDKPVKVDGLYYYIWQRDDKNVASVCASQEGVYNINDIIVPDNITYEDTQYDVIELVENAFMDCKNIKNIRLGKNITQIWGVVFWNSSVENIYFPENDELRVEYGVFLNCNNLDSLVFNSERTTLVTAWHASTGIKKIRFTKKAQLSALPTAGIIQNKTSKGNSDYRAEQEKVQMPEIVWSEVSNLALVHSLSGYEVEHLKLPNTVVLQGNGYGGVGLENMTTLELAATDESTAAQLIDDVYGTNRYPADRDYSQIGMTSLVECGKLTTIISHGVTPWTIADDAFASDEAMKAITLYVPREAIDTYKAHPVWGKMGAIVAIETVKPMVVEGRTWWYKAEEYGADVEYGIRIGSEAEIDGKTYNKVYMCLNHKNITFENTYVDPTYTWMEMNEDEGLDAYIREEEGKVYVLFTVPERTVSEKYPGQRLYGFTGGSVLASRLPREENIDILMYDFTPGKGTLSLGWGEPDPDFPWLHNLDFNLTGTETMESCGNEYNTYKYEFEAVDDWGWYEVPDRFTVVEGIGILTEDNGFTHCLFYNLFPAKLDSHNVTVELRYVTEGEDNHIIFENLGGKKLWVEYAGVDNIKADDNTAAAEYFNLQGQRVGNPAAGQLVIRRQGDRITKLVVK